MTGGTAAATTAEPIEPPHARLLRAGARALSDAELLAVVLRHGRPGRSAVDVAGELLAKAGGLPGLAGACARRLRSNGVSRAKIAAVLAAAEIACRMAAARISDKAPLSQPAAIARYIDLRYARRRQEILGALYLNARLHLIEERELYRGTLHRAAVEPREVLREALLCGAAGVLMYHTHPHGDPTPSREDIAFTRRMARAGEVVGVCLADHMIVGAGGDFVSLKARGGW